MSEDGEDGSLIADLGIRGVWSPQSEALFDIRVTDTDAQSYLHHAPESVSFQAETEKKQRYSAAATARHAHFTPLCFSVDGLAGSEAVCFVTALNRHQYNTITIGTCAKTLIKVSRSKYSNT